MRVAASEKEAYTAVKNGSALASRKASTAGSVLACTLPKSVLVWVFAYYKKYEGRTVLSMMRLFGRLPVKGDVLCMFAGGEGTVYCRIEEVSPPTRSAREVLTKTTWREYVPWVTTLRAALRVYESMDNGSGFVFMKYSYPHKYDRIGDTPRRL